jgi:hypothetical protein
MRFRCSSETPGGRLPGVPVPLCLEPGENTEPGTTEAVGVAVPELGRDPDIEVVDLNSWCSEAFDLRYGSEARDDEGDAARCLGRIIEFSRSAG